MIDLRNSYWCKVCSCVFSVLDLNKLHTQDRYYFCSAQCLQKYRHWKNGDCCLHSRSYGVKL